MKQLYNTDNGYATAFDALLDAVNQAETQSEERFYPLFDAATDTPNNIATAADIAALDELAPPKRTTNWTTWQKLIDSTHPQARRQLEENWVDLVSDLKTRAFITHDELLRGSLHDIKTRIARHNRIFSAAQLIHPTARRRLDKRDGEALAADAIKQIVDARNEKISIFAQQRYSEISAQARELANSYKARLAMIDLERDRKNIDAVEYDDLLDALVEDIVKERKSISEQYNPAQLIKKTTAHGFCHRAGETKFWRQGLLRKVNQLNNSILRPFSTWSQSNLKLCDEAAERYRDREKNTQAWLENQWIYREDGHPNDGFTLDKVFDSSTNNPANYVKELAVRAIALARFCEKRGLVPTFITCTLPSRFHKKAFTGRYAVTDELDETGHPRQVPIYKDNPRADETLSNEDGIKRLNQGFANIRKKLGKLGIKIHYIRSLEPHREGAPHLHAVAWAQPGELDTVEELFMHEYLHRDTPDERGAAERRVRIVRPDASSKNGAEGAVHYLMKTLLYVTKSASERGGTLDWARSCGARIVEMSVSYVMLWRFLRSINDPRDVPRALIPAWHYSHGFCTEPSKMFFRESDFTDKNDPTFAVRAMNKSSTTTPDHFLAFIEDPAVSKFKIGGFLGNENELNDHGERVFHSSKTLKIYQPDASAPGAIPAREALSWREDYPARVLETAIEKAEAAGMMNVTCNGITTAEFFEALAKAPDIYEDEIYRFEAEPGEPNFEIESRAHCEEVLVKWHKFITDAPRSNYLGYMAQLTQRATKAAIELISKIERDARSMSHEAAQSLTKTIIDDLGIRASETLDLVQQRLEILSGGHFQLRDQGARQKLVLRVMDKLRKVFGDHIIPPDPPPQTA